MKYNENLIFSLLSRKNGIPYSIPFSADLCFRPVFRYVDDIDSSVIEVLHATFHIIQIMDEVRREQFSGRTHAYDLTAPDGNQPVAVHSCDIEIMNGAHHGQVQGFHDIHAADAGQIRMKCIPMSALIFIRYENHILSHN